MPKDTSAYREYRENRKDDPPHLGMLRSEYMFEAETKDRRRQSARLHAHVRTEPSIRAPQPDQSKAKPAEPEVKNLEYVSPWLGNLPKNIPYFTPQDRLHDEILAYAEWITATPEENMANQLLIFCMSHWVQNRSPHIAIPACLYGSVSTGLSLPTSNLNIEVNTTDKGNGSKALRNLLRSMISSGLTSEARSQIRPTGEQGALLHVITRPGLGSKTIIITRHNPTCLETTDALKDHLDRMPALRPLVLVLKCFLRQRDLESGDRGLGSYALTCLCIEFIKNNPFKRPSQLFDNPFEARSLGILLTDFFLFFGSETGRMVILAQNAKLNSKRPNFATIKDSTEVWSNFDRLAQVVRCFSFASASILNKKASDENLLAPIVALNQECLNHRANIRCMVRAGGFDRIADAFEKSNRKIRIRPVNYLLDEDVRSKIYSQKPQVKKVTQAQSTKGRKSKAKRARDSKKCLKDIRAAVMEAERLAALASVALATSDSPLVGPTRPFKMEAGAATPATKSITAAASSASVCSSLSVEMELESDLSEVEAMLMLGRMDTEDALVRTEETPIKMETNPPSL